MKKWFLILMFVGVHLFVVACDGQFGDADTEAADEVTLPDVEVATFVAEVDHEYFPLPVGATWVYEAETADGLERIEVEVLEETRDIEGVVATVVRDTAYLDGELVEDTEDWYAQDSEGNVWYLGEETCEFEADECVSTAGSWEWAVDGALPGIIMPADPAVDGEAYYQEFDEDNAEDVGEVVTVAETVEVTAGTFADCIKTHDTSTLDLDLDEFKYYCPGIGNALVEEPDADVQLIEYSGL